MSRQAVAENLQLRMAATEADLRMAQRLRYDVFVQELGGDGTMVDHAAGLEQDRFDGFCDHLLLFDPARRAGDQLVGVYRVMNAVQAQAAGGFYTAGEYDLAPILETGRPVLELGRTCVHADYRDGTALRHLWRGLAAHVARSGAEVLFGTASFHGTDLAALAQPLALLEARHAAALRPVARGATAAPLTQIAPAALDRKAALRAMPALIKSYLRLGGGVGQGAYVDHAFNTTDVCMVLDVTAMPASQRALYLQDAG